MIASMESNVIYRRTCWCFPLKKSYGDDSKHCYQEKGIYKLGMEAEEYIELTFSK